MRITDALEAVQMIDNGSTLMIGGFMAVGTPETLVDAIMIQGIGGLTVISNDTGFENKGVGKLIGDGRIANLIASHVGTNPETGRQINSGKINATLLPQGSLVEKIRAGGSGLGGVLTPTGLGTVVADGKDVLKINDQPYLLELPLRADFALIQAWKADLAGNLIYHGSARNFNPIMVLAADTVIVEADEIVEDGYLDPDQVVTPGILVDYLVKKVE
ncbi:MAG: CoA transferase subunit A [Ignavibacteriales bacterium]